MDIPLAERGNYYRGLLVLIRKDRIISARERDLMIRLGQGLDFDPRFCEGAIDDILKNPHIKNKPMRFSDRSIARRFVHDALMIAMIDGEIHPDEWTWIRAVARENGLTDREIGDGAGSPAPVEPFPG
jgi:hypothetical protein